MSSQENSIIFNFPVHNSYSTFVLKYSSIVYHTLWDFLGSIGHATVGDGVVRTPCPVAGVSPLPNHWTCLACWLYLLVVDGESSS